MNTNFENPTIRKINVYNNKNDKSILKLNENLESEINSINDDSFIFDGKIFKKSNNYSKYKKKIILKGIFINVNTIGMKKNLERK